MTQALVIFSDNSGIWWLKFLKSGFRHCFVILEVDNQAILIDPTMTKFNLGIIESSSFLQLSRWYREQGMQVLHIEIKQSKPKTYGWSPFTCVEVVKRILGIRDAFLLTPWQLFNKIKNKDRKYENSP